MKIVRAKISANELLKNEDPKRVLDKVRAQWRFVTSQNAGTPPSEEETLTQKIEDQCKVKWYHISIEGLDNNNRGKRYSLHLFPIGN